MKLAVCLTALCWLTLGLTCRAYSFSNYCVEKRVPASRMSQHCQGMSLSSYQTRNFGGEELRCSHGSQTRVREPVPFDEEAWRDLRNVDPESAKDMLRALPVPKWKGTVHYDTYLHWSWEDCQLVTSFSCGSYTVCTTKKNADGKEETTCHEEPETCYQDVPVYETEHCSPETLTYDVKFLQVDREDNDYLERLANGFDLLPGEEEGIAFSNGVGSIRSAIMTPQLSVDEPRNNYLISNMTGDTYDRASFMCRQHSTYHAGFHVLPLKRIRSRSGNAFAFPESFDNEKIDPLVWLGANDTNGQWQDKGHPAVLRVQDYSATSLNEFSRDTGDILKNSMVRIQLYDRSSYGWPFARNTIYVNEGKAVAQTLNALSENQKVRRSHLWELMLASGSVDPKKNLYRNYIPWYAYYPARLLFPAESLSYENQLSPETDYKLRLTVYQRGLSIYHQSCEDDPEAWDCRFYAGGGWFSPKRYESGYYSDKSLDVDFSTRESVNQRSYWPMFWNTMNATNGMALMGLAAWGAMRMMPVR